MLGHRPDIAVIASREADRAVPFFWDPGGMALYQACVADGLVPVTRYRFHDTYYLLVLARPGSVWAQELGGDAAAVGQAAR